ncbi:RHS repeat-associated core domain-containing protein [Capnocytophaga canimorsus]|uniref:RHS repeat-associated core domain-containing protein n=1 Tax=Capnocytophaga canimorsus TaxID=28188 RepID=UPI00293BD64B|nr:RHS repeat-associated core domain-containing protein [Capnocytophaga canimorsus]
MYGRVRKEKGTSNFVPFRYQGQYYDGEIDLCYNRFRYYDCNTGMYISQDPISILGGLNLYSYVFDSNGWADVFGLDLHHIIPNQIYNEYSKYFDKIIGYEQNKYKTKPNKTNLIDLNKPFHGNHPAYSSYVREQVESMIKENKFNLKNISELQKEMNIFIDDALKNYENTNMNLNDYFKSGKHLEFLNKNKNKFKICK